MIKKLLLLTIASVFSLMGWSQQQYFLYQEVTDPVATLAANGTMVAIVKENNCIGFNNSDNQLSYFAISSIDPDVYGVYYTFEATGTTDEYFIKVHHLDGSVMAGPWDSATDANCGYMNEVGGWTTNVSKKRGDDNAIQTSAKWLVTKTNDGYYLKSQSRNSFLCPGGKNEYHTTQSPNYAWRFYTMKQGIDMTSSVPNACGYMHEGSPIPAGDNTTTQLKYDPENWTVTWASGVSAPSNFQFTTNNWSLEGNSDGSNMKNPYIQVWNGSYDPIPNCTIAHDPVTGLPAGEYTLRIFARSLNKDGNYKCSGTEIYANDQNVRLSSGIQCNYNSGSKSGKYNYYTINFTLTEGQALNFGFRLTNADYYFLTYKDVTLTYFPGADPSQALAILINQAKGQASAASALLNEKQDATIKAALQTAVNNINAINEASATTDGVQALIDALTTAEANSRESIYYYSAVNTVLTNATAKATAWGFQIDASAITAAYNNGTLDDDAIPTVKNLLATAVKSQTAPLSDMTDAIINASCAEYNGVALPANINSVDALHVAPDAWTLTYSDGAAHSGVQFCVNNWSTEGNTDGSNMRNPFIQYYNANGSDTTLPDATMAHDKITGLPAGQYTISILGRTAHKDTNNKCSGTVFYANGQEVRFSSGTAYSYNDGAKTGKYGIYSIDLDLTEGQDLDFGVYTQGADYYFLSFKDVALTYWGNQRDNFEEIPQSNADGGGASKIVSSGYIQYTASGQTQIAIKVKNIDVSSADYVVIKFAEPVYSSAWKIAYSGVESTDAWNDIPQGALEYVIPIEGTQYANTGILPEVTLMTAWEAGDPIKVKGVYKHLKPGITMSVSANDQWATFVAPMNIPLAQLPEGITAYSVSYDATNGKTVNTPVESFIEAGTPVLLRNSTTNDITKKFAFDGTLPTGLCQDGILIGSCTDIAAIPQTTAQGYPTYVLDTRNGDTGWYKVGTDNISLPAFSAYCFINDANAADYYPAGEDFTLEFDMENPSARAFLDNTTYTRSSGSVITNYCNASTSYRKDRPSGVTLKWKADSSSAQTITISENEDYSYGITYSVDQAVGEYTVYNLIPDRVYYYKVSSNTTGNIIMKGSVKGRGPLRMGYVSSISNVRDLGGWTTQSGYKVVYGKIYRGAELNGGNGRIGDAGLDAMRNKLGIRADLDIRMDDQCDYYDHSPLGTDVSYRHTPQTNGYLDRMKGDKTLWRDNLRFVLENIKNDRPVYFHCQVGADRTGTMAFLIEGLLGMTMSDMYKDYELTSFSYLNTVRYKTQIDDMFDYVNTFAGETLEDRFYTYITTEIGLTAQEVADFRGIMLGTYSPEEIINSLLDEAEGLLDSYMNLEVKADLQQAMTDVENLDDDASDSTIQAAIRELSTAIEAAKQSIADYEKTNTAISTFTAKAALLDAAGQAAFDVSEIAAAYTAGTLEGSGYNAIRENYMDAVKSQTTAGADMTGAIINACCYEHDGIKITSGTSSNKRLADDWPLSISWNDYCINTWSTEGETDGSQMTTPYLQYWTPNAKLNNSTIDHSTINGLPAGNYQISIFVRTLQKKSQLDDENDPNPYKAGGCVFYANDETIALSTGTNCAMSDMSKAGKYGTYTINFTLEEDDPLNIGFRLQDVDFYFLTFRDCHLTYLGASSAADELVEIEQTVSDGGLANKQEFEKYTQYTATGATQVAVKVKNIEVTNCDYIVLKFAEPVNSTDWKVAYSGVMSDAAWNSIPLGATKYTIQIAGTQYETAGILPEVTLMSGWNAPSVPVKLKGIYKHFVLEATEVLTDIDHNIFKRWTGAGATATPTSEQPYFGHNMNQSTDMVYGDVNVNYHNYADLTNATELILTVNEGTPRILFNRQESSSGNGGAFLEIANDNSEYWTVSTTNGGYPKTYRVNIAKVKAWNNYGYAHLNVIKGAGGGNVYATQLKYSTGSTPVEYATSLSSVDDYAWSTLYLDYAVEIPEGVNAYYAVLNGNSVDLVEIDPVIPARTAVILRSSAASTGMPTQFECTDVENNEAETIAAENLLVGYSYDHPITGTADAAYYALNYKTVNGVKVPGFFAPKGSDNDPNGNFLAKKSKAYLKIAGGSEVKEFFTFNFNDDVNSITDVTLDKNVNGLIYNIAGQVVDENYKGIVIKNGKKYINK